MRLIVCGGRDFVDRAKAFAALDAVHAKTPITLIIAGGARGADELAINWATGRGVSFHTETADWNQHGRKAGPLRNAKMLTLAPDGVLALPGGRGTADMIRQAEAAGVTVWRPYG